ncbi:TIGR03013 family XrtA/PEP-CTERM system glycosyltransferase [Fundidesulfovibrio magnetotacticus]|nr:TIGR03013 family XrtA/PEP-CTERM system glycosyltransferase [Fundidesulfovibrio magnetotacticus]
MEEHGIQRGYGKLALSQCALDVLAAVMALQITLLLSPMMAKVHNFFLLPADDTLHFIVIAAFPSIILGIIIAYAARKKGLAIHLVKTMLSVLASFIIFLALEEVNIPHRLSSVEITLGVALFATLSLGRELFCALRSWASDGTCRVLLVGNGQLAFQIEELIRSMSGKFQLVGKVHYPGPDNAAKAEDAQDIFETAKRLDANKVVISLTERRGVFPLQEMLNCKLSGIEVLDSPSLYERLTGKLLIENITPSWFIFCHGFRVTPGLRLVKRAIDIALSSLGLLCFAPFGLLVALAIRLDSPGPVFFRQVRVGEGDQLFSLIKFRSMRQDAEKLSGAVWAQKNDNRVTRLGKFLRKSRIDEIPQLINVLRGEMSLVGPRPERPEFVRTLKERIPYYSERHFVKPGVSGWAQVRYPYGASVEDAVEKLRYDLYYIKNISILLDFKIILKTVAVMLFCRGGR